MEDPPGTSGLKEEQLMDLGPQGGPAISSWPEGSAVVVVGRPGQLGTKGPHASTKRSKKGKLKASKGLAPPPLGPADFVRVVPVPKRSEVLHEGWRPVQVSRLDKASGVEVDEARANITSRKGYRMARGTHGAFEGAWYFEVTILRLGSTGHVRLGWSTRKGELQAPVGYDEFSFGYRDLEGTKVHKALREDYGEPFSEGDVIGCFLWLPVGGRPFEKDKSDIVTWKGNLYFKEDKEEPERLPVTGSAVAFTKNGKLQGVAYRDIMEGTYYPAVSLFTHPDQREGAAAAFNFGPDFRHDPPTLEGCPAARPVAELAGDPEQKLQPVQPLQLEAGPDVKQPMDMT